MKKNITRTGMVFLILTTAFFALYSLLNLSTFFIFNFVDIPIPVIISYSIGSIISLVTIMFVLKNAKKSFITLAIWGSLSLIITSIYIIVLNWMEFKERVSTLISPEVASGFLLATLLVIFSIYINYCLSKKNNK